MADKNTTALTAGTTPDGTELITVTQSGNSRKLTVKQIASAPQTARVAFFSPGSPTADQVILQLVFASAQSLPAGATASVGYVGTQGSDGTTTFNIKKNGSNVGTMQFSVATSTATFTVATQVNFAIGDRMEIVAPSTPDSTLADLSATLILPST